MPYGALGSAGRDLPEAAVTTRGLAFALTLAAASGAEAQEVDRNVVRLEWGALNILVIKDTLNGMGLWVATTPVGERKGLEEDQFVAHYDPDVVRSWLDEVQLLMGPDRVGASDPTQLQTPPLADLMGGRIFAVRVRDRDRWSRRVIFSLSYGREEQPLQFAVDRRDVPRMLAAIAEGARDSRLVTTPVPGQVPFYANPADPSTMPQGAGVRGVVYPQHLVNQRIQGDVWFSYVVDSTGQVRVDESLKVLLSDHPLLTQTARESIRDAKYRPAVRRGRPVPIRVYQRVMYRIRE
jgi:hypothetical protein